ncbi:MAG: hypothetical protein KF729_23485 [Sandaracinaceae bacterium]|nr:hypothetical protein [Sandaracinaceae bacterium]
MRTSSTAALLVALLGLAPAAARADVEGVFALETGLSIAEPSLVVGVEGGVRLDRQWTFLLEIDWNPWFSIEGAVVHEGALNIGVGVEHIYQDGLLRSALFVGTSTLLYQTALDVPGTTGPFVDFVPISVRVPLEGDVVTLRIDPVSMHLLAPVLSGIPLIRYEFRHVLSIELAGR